MNLGILLHRKLTPCIYCGVTLDQCACTDDPGDRGDPAITFEQVPTAVWPEDKREFYLDVQDTALRVGGICVWAFNALFSQCGPLHQFYLPPLNPYPPDWWKKEAR